MMLNDVKLSFENRKQRMILYLKFPSRSDIYTGVSQGSVVYR